MNTLVHTHAHARRGVKRTVGEKIRDIRHTKDEEKGRITNKMGDRRGDSVCVCVEAGADGLVNGVDAVFRVTFTLNRLTDAYIQTNVRGATKIIKA